MICVPIKKKSSQSLLRILKEAQVHADLVEIWFDELKDLNESNLEKIFKIKKGPYIYKVSAKTPSAKILANPIDFIDLDIKTPKSQVEQIPKRIKKIISFHDFKKTPSRDSLQEIADKALSKGADIIKIATFAKTHTDSFQMLEFLNKLTKKGHKAICLCMGEKGRLTRTTGHLFGNFLMYVPLNKKDATAKGQLTLKEWLSKSE